MTQDSDQSVDCKHGNETSGSTEERNLLINWIATNYMRNLLHMVLIN
jgi:hypothetical protein